MAESMGRWIFNFISSGSILHWHQECTSVLLALHPCQCFMLHLSNFSHIFMVLSHYNFHFHLCVSQYQLSIFFTCLLVIPRSFFKWSVHVFNSFFFFFLHFSLLSLYILKELIRYMYTSIFSLCLDCFLLDIFWWINDFNFVKLWSIFFFFLIVHDFCILSKASWLIKKLWRFSLSLFLEDLPSWLLWLDLWFTSN